MNDEHYLDYCSNLLDGFAKDLTQRTVSLPEDNPLRQLSQAFTDLAAQRENLYETGGELIQNLFNNHPDMAPLLPRQLLWFLGGDCLHFMPDEEIAKFQQLEEEREQAVASGEVYDLRGAGAKLLNLQ
jgi:hypothetical protein